METERPQIVVTDTGLETPRGTRIELKLGGHAQVCCIHDQEKRSITELVLRKGMYMQVCPCCENLFYHETDFPHFCVKCGGRKVPGGEHLPRGKGV